MVDILHLSDLHTLAKSTYSAVRTHIANPLNGRTFDFVVVSGDLTDRAQRNEYEQLKVFVRNDLPKFLRRAHEPWRVILIPGNHDVDWAANVFEHVSAESVERQFSGSTDPVRAMEAELSRPLESDLRRHKTSGGHQDWYRIKTADYSKRFGNCQAFLTEFYDSTPPGVHRPFDFEHPGQDWSAHIFHEEQVVFVGLNSCHRNDRFHRGAAFDRRVFNSIGEHLEGGPQRDYLRIAVWHHGIRGDKNSIDYLNMGFVGDAYAAGFSLALHGHTHSAASELLEHLLPGQMAIVSTGSLGAAAEDRPEATGNQFSAISVYSGSIRVELFKQDAVNRNFTPSQPRLVRYRQVEDGSTATPMCSRQQRTYTFDEDGIGHVVVLLDNASSEESIRFGLLREPYCTARHEVARTRAGDEIAVEGKELGPLGGGISFEMRRRLSGEDVRWSYSASNLIPLTKADNELQDQHEACQPGVGSGMCVRPHTVRIASDELILRYRFPTDVVDLTRVEAIVERAPGLPTAERWHQVARESLRCKVETDHEAEVDTNLSRDVVELRVRRPVVGWRYSVAVGLKRSGGGLNGLDLRIAEQLMAKAQERVGRRQFKELASILSEMVGDVLGGPLDGLSWVGFLWSRSEKRLVPMFGEFPTQTWSARFAHGTGVAGHCFRFSKIASWFEGGKGRESLIFQRRPQGLSRDDPHEWVVCVPLLVGPDGPAIGVVSFESTSKTGGTACMRLRSFAEDCATDSQSASVLSTVSKLTLSTNVSFWPFAEANLENDERTRCAEILALLRAAWDVRGPGDEDM